MRNSLVHRTMFSALSDSIGRRPVYGGAALFSALFAYPFFVMGGTRLPAAFILARADLAIAICVSGMSDPRPRSCGVRSGQSCDTAASTRRANFGSICRRTCTLRRTWLLARQKTNPGSCRIM